MIMRKIIFSVTLGLLVSISGAPCHAQDNLGSFKGKLITEALDDGRNLRIIAPMSYIDPKGKTWKVQKGMTTDGASVPRFFWSLFPPFSGKHRRAAVLHDRYCQTRNRPWRSVHQMFYDAMLAAGVDVVSANTMYGAVYSFGPRWSMTGPTRALKRPRLSDQDQEKAFRKLQTWIRKTKPTPQEIERHVNRTRLRQLGSKAEQ